MPGGNVIVNTSPVTPRIDQQLNGGYNSTGNNPQNPGFVAAGQPNSPTGGGATGGAGSNASSETQVMQCVRTRYVITAADVAQGFAVIRVYWNIPYPDINYTCWFGINDIVGGAGLDFYCGDIHNKTGKSIDCVAYCYSPGVGTAGDVVEINAAAVHD